MEIVKSNITLVIAVLESDLGKLPRTKRGSREMHAVLSYGSVDNSSLAIEVLLQRVRDNNYQLTITIPSEINPIRQIVLP